MYIERISILNFKNIADATLEFSPRVNCFLGLNGMGKSNLLEAIYFLSFVRSFGQLPDSALIRHGQEMLMVQGVYQKQSGSMENISCGIVAGKRKTLKRNGKEYDRLSEHVGSVPIVVVSPADTALISDSAEERRRFVNGFISQLDKTYLDAVMRYNTALANRNSYLKIGSDEEMLRIYDAQMAPVAAKIHQARLEVTELLYPLVCEYYRALSDDHEQVELEYRSELNNATLEELLQASRERDRVNGFTTCGVHRDDLRFSIGGYQLRKYGSQGQQKSFLIALKLAQYRIVAQACGEKPILLLDDLFDKLDESRVSRLIELVKGEEFGQVIITDCNGERMGNILHKAECSYKLFNVTYGEVLKEM